MTTKMVERTPDELAYRRDRPELLNRFPPKRFVAYGGGKLIADTESFEAMLVKLRELGWAPRTTMVFRIGDEVYDYLDIL